MSTPRFVVAYRDGTAVAVVADHLVPIVPLTARLIAGGKGGDLVVRNPDSGHVHVVCPLARALDPPGYRPGRATPELPK